MLKFFKISGLLITFFLLQAFQPGKNSLLLEGTLNCNSGAVKIVRSRFALDSQEENLPSLSAAQDRLRSAGYSEEGIKKLSEILTAVCTGSELGPAVSSAKEESVARQEGTIVQAKPRTIKRNSGSLLWLKKQNQIVTFAVYQDTSGVVEYDASGRPTSSASAERVASYSRAKGEPDCKPISNVCVKCSDGKIICSTPRLK